MRGTLRLQSSRVLSFYLEELHALGAELSLAAHLADISEELRILAERSPDTSPHRSGEPYRLAVSGIYARLAATAMRLEVETTRPPVGKAEPYASVSEFQADLDVLDRSLIANNSGVIARGRLRQLRRAVDCFGFHLARPRHPPELGGARAHHRRAVRHRQSRHVLSGARRGGARQRCCSASCATRGRWPRRSSNIPRRRKASSRVFRAAAEAHAKFGPEVISQCIISMCKGMSDMLEVAVLLKEVGLVNPSGRSADQHRAAVRDHRGSAGLRAASWTACWRCTTTASWSTAAAACRR